MKSRWFLAVVAALGLAGPALQAQETEFPRDLHGLWWDPGDPGWAAAVFDHQHAMSSVLLHYDYDGVPTWLTAPTLHCYRERPPFLNTFCDGAMYRVTGPWFGAPYRASEVSAQEVGEWNGSFLSPLALGNGPDRRRVLFLNYSIGSVKVIGSGVKPMYIQVIDTETRDFLWQDGRYSGLWANPDENGWGIGVFVQNNALHATLLVHARDGRPVWYVVIGKGNAFEEGVDRIFQAEVYETRGFENGLSIGRAGVSDVRRVGSATLRFTNGPYDPASLTYEIDGVRVSKTIHRASF